MSVTSDVLSRIFELVESFIASPNKAADAVAEATAMLPAERVEETNAVLSDNRISYRDGVIIQLTFGLVADQSLDLTRRPEGGRTVAKRLGEFFAEHHIRHVKDAYQNIAKNTKVLTRGNFAEFDSLLNWATRASSPELESALQYACAVVAKTARPVLPMPELNRGKLTFAATCKLIGVLLDTPSQGSNEQFVVAALLNALVAEFSGKTQRVETKNLNASDRSSFAAGDVQVLIGNRVIEAFEVTANNWRTKLAGASKSIRDNDLSRLQIIARRPDNERTDMIEKLGSMPDDIAVLDTQQFSEVLIAALTRSGRAAALYRLYEYLDRYQPNTERVNFLVEQLAQCGLVEGYGD